MPPLSERADAAIALCLSLVPVVVAVWFVQGFSLEVPLFDQWTLLQLYAKLHAGEAGAADLFQPHNGLHVPVFARLILAGIARATDWSFRAETYVGFALALATAWSVHRMAKVTFPGSSAPRAAWVCLVLTMGLLFSPVLEWIWTWSVGFFHYFGNACVVGAIAALTVRPLRLWVPFVLCFVASYNRFEGLFTWVLLLPLLREATRASPRRTRVLRAWCVTGALTWVGCLAPVIAARAAATPAPPSESPVSHALLLAFSMVGFAPAYFTEEWSRLGPANGYAPAGLLVVLAFAGTSVRLLRSTESRTRALPFVTLGAFGLAFTFCAAAGRSWLGAPGDPDGRHPWLLGWHLSAYATTSTLVAVATVHLVALSFLARAGSSPRHRLAGPALACAGALALLAGYAHAAPKLAARRAVGRSDRYCVELAWYLDDASACMVPKEAIPLLRKAGLRRMLRQLEYVDEPATSPGRIERAIRENLPEGESIVVVGRVAPPAVDGAVLFTFDRSQRFFTKATTKPLATGGLAFTGKIPAGTFDATEEEVEAWYYDPERGTVTALSGRARALLR